MSIVFEKKKTKKIWIASFFYAVTEIMESTWQLMTTVIFFLVQSNILHAHREHKVRKIIKRTLLLTYLEYFLRAFNHPFQVHNIVLYPDKHSWCKTTPIKQVVAWPQCSSQELDNNVCVGACFSYMVPHSEPSAPGDLIRPYCDSCQPLDSVWHTVGNSVNAIRISK